MMKKIDGLTATLILGSVISTIFLVIALVTKTPCIATIWLLALGVFGISAIVRFI